MIILNKKQLIDAQNELWNKRNNMTLKEFSNANVELYSRFEMRLDDIIEHLQAIRHDHGNIKVLKEQLYAGTMHLSNIHVQKRNDTDDEWVVAIY